MDRPATTIRIEPLGAPLVVQDGALQRPPIKKSIALLALEGRCTRAKLATLLWDLLDDEVARRNLRRELHRLREAGLHEVLATRDDQVALAAGVGSDAAEFAAALALRERLIAHDPLQESQLVHAMRLHVTLASAPQHSIALRAAARARAQVLAATLDDGALRERFVPRHGALIGD